MKPFFPCQECAFHYVKDFNADLYVNIKEIIKDSLSLGFWKAVSKYMHVSLMKRVMIVISKWPTDVFI